MDTLTKLRSGKLQGIKRLDLSCGLTEFPEEIFQLADTLEILNLSGNALSSLPNDLPRLHKLRVIFCSDNQFTEVPEVLGRCPNLSMVGFKANQINTFTAFAIPPKLRWLILTDNQLESVPKELGRCTELQKLMLAGNRLQHLPDEFAACTKLELLRISANRFESLPEWLLKLPRLAWLAYAGNPYSDAHEHAITEMSDIPCINWHELELQQQLGEGASGVIHQAVWRRFGEVQAVAVKLFKGALTSDGLPRSEKAASLAAGLHRSLVGASGKIIEHPQGSKGLVMPLVEAGYSILAGPPSLESCTRDVYAPQRRFTFKELLRLTHGVADAVAHLHQRGILHGDLYAHNILCNEHGDALLGDFGAATFLPEESGALQRIEVRAFGCLLEELLERCEPAETEALWSLYRRCVHPDVATRPLFAEIVSELDGMTHAS
ncbi:MAG: leucine-rich repeat-containing protein kinase family protein [Gallionella sp.]|nr:leucine-rich repeat-containing protein kinase family protein [Gallionella sp.]